MKIMKTDNTLKEYFNYKDNSFKFGKWIDNFSKLPNNTLACHWHEEFEFGVIVSGKLDYSFNGNHIELQKGDCIFVNSNTLHSAVELQSATMIIFAFHPSIISKLNDIVYRKYINPIILSNIQGFKINQDDIYGNKTIQLLQQLSKLNTADFGYELQCLSLLNQIWYNFTLYIDTHKNILIEKNSNLKHKEEIKEIIKYIQKHYNETITIDNLTKVVGISKSECFRSFKEFTNKTIIEYINEYRLSHSVNLLLNTDLSMTEIATSCGFSNSSYFGELFKKIYGITPLQYRKKSLIS